MDSEVTKVKIRRFSYEGSRESQLWPVSLSIAAFRHHTVVLKSPYQHSCMCTAEFIFKLYPRYYIIPSFPNFISLLCHIFRITSCLLTRKYV